MTMLRSLALASLLCVELMRATPAFACGGGFGGDLEIHADQTVALSHRDGIETYVFQPAFCAGRQAFGLILPIPTVLEADPRVADEDLFEALAEISAPKIETETVCRADSDSKGSRGAGGSADAGGSDDELNEGADVLGEGRVDIFDWVLIEAESTADLTKWLNDNSFPYDSYAMEAFTSYIDEGFNFVAFKVAQDALDGEDCGAFAPIELRFATETPIVPLRMATAHEDATWSLFRWRVFAVSDTQLAITPGALSGEGALRFSGVVDADALEQWPALAAIARQGERLTELDIELDGASVEGDLQLEETPTEDYRRVRRVTRYEDCGGCSVSASRAGVESWAAIAIGLLFVVRHRRARS
jgi:hypothetical protein